MVEARSATCSLDLLTHDLNTSLLDKVDSHAQFHSIDQHSSTAMDSPRISSTPPSTPGLESNQGKDTKDDEDEDEEDGDGDYNDYTDYAYDEYINGDYSEPDEDYFFKDFATNTDSTTTPSTNRPKSKRYSRRRRSQKVMSRFDLQSFARQLHANRLSVLQTRQSRMILTEEDEQELDRLLARKVTQGAVGSLSSPPPVPALPPVPASLSQPAPLTTPLSPAEKETEMEIDTSTTIGGFKAMVIEPSSDLAGPIPYGSISSDSPKKPSLLLQKLNDQHPSIRSKNATFVEMAPLSPSLSDPSSFISPRRAPTPPSETSSPFSLSASLSSSSTSTSVTAKDHKLSHPVATTVTLGPAPTSFTVKKKSSWRANRKQLKNQDQPKVALPLSPLSPTATHLRQSISLDSLRDAPQSKDSWKLTKASATKPAIATSTTTTKVPATVSVSSSVQPSTTPAFVDNSKKPKSRLFGSLRQASRSSRAAGEGAIRGLMRNLSTVGQRTQHQQQQQQQQQQTDQVVSSLTDNSTMSRAAKAVIQHDVSSKKKPANKKSKTASASALGQGVDVTDGMDDSTVQVTHTATSTKGGVRL
ncbi:hypothetical protein BCR42DRAFT_60982 [Absidia repens]|uniref:Uncharacterized protein n=1 Tax=Absidia repens TaxID=90262 RepID=A0A1X2ICN5_9FUNG|nr:hypothetical protein BCR42DRAFT_60982 [Absidia repens]